VTFTEFTLDGMKIHPGRGPGSFQTPEYLSGWTDHVHDWADGAAWLLTNPTGYVVGRGHVSRLTNLDPWQRNRYDTTQHFSYFAIYDGATNAAAPLVRSRDNNSVGPGGRPGPLASRYRSIPTRSPLNLHAF
jgi:hypothetical protein